MYMRLLWGKKELYSYCEILLAILLYLFSPNIYVWEYNVCCGILYLLAVIRYLSFQKKNNYLDFETIFLLSYFFCFFVYPIFLYEINPHYFSMFVYEFDHDKITEGTALALLGGVFFLYGCESGKSRAMKCKLNNKSYKFPIRIFYIITVTCFFCFLALGGYSSFKSMYADGEGGGSGIFSYFLILFVAFYIVSITLEYYNAIISLRNGFRAKLNKFFILFIFFASAILLIAGTRTIVLQMFLSIIGLYCLFFRPIKLLEFVLLALCGAIFFTVIAFTRKGNVVDIDSFWDIFMDLIINNRSTYFALSYVDEHGISWGVTMLGYIMKPFPFLQGIVAKIFGLDPSYLTTATLVTVETLGKGSSLGLGTNIIADLYMAFGAWGVVIGMFVLGFYSKKSYYMAKEGSIYYMLFYTVLLSLSVYIVRSEFFYCLNILVWAFVIVNIAIHFAKHSRRALCK